MYRRKVRIEIEEGASAPMWNLPEPCIPMEDGWCRRRGERFGCGGRGTVCLGYVDTSDANLHNT